jgi:hypothetical protein
MGLFFRSYGFPSPSRPHLDDRFRPGVPPNLAASEVLDKVRELWDNYPGPLIGVPMGEASGLFLLDIDSGFGKEHAAAARDWFADNHERLPFSAAP